MSELKGNFKATYDVVKRAERCVLLRSKAANPSHTYAVGNVDGNGLVFDEDKAKEILLEDEIEIFVKLGDGNASAEAYGCDLTYDYVKINGDYRT